MLLTKFNDADIYNAAQLTAAVWGDELPWPDSRLKNFVYQAMVRYYSKNNALSFKFSDAGIMQGFLLAGKKCDKSCFAEWFDTQSRFFTVQERQIAESYMNYLAYNGSALDSCSTDSDLQLLLYLSTVRGGGSLLLNNILCLARQKGFASLLLWADETCDLDYYEKKGFVLRKTFVNDKMPLLGKQKTVIFAKKLAENG